jgi:hypothetical protein
MSHSFHIPVLGLGYSIDTPLKVARFGISSVVSIVDDELIERMRKYHSEQNHLTFLPISKKVEDSRAKRITAYLNLLLTLVNRQIAKLRTQSFEPGTDLSRYFELLPQQSELKIRYASMTGTTGDLKKELQQHLKSDIRAGSIDVNIMSKVDKANYSADGEYAGDNFTDAIAAMRGFAESDLEGSVIISAGLNPRLYAYMENCPCFYSADRPASKQIILKVSDYRSALIQAKVLAKKGLWVSEFRIESGLNCGGHAFATDGLLVGPILQEFKDNREVLATEIWNVCQAALTAKGMQAGTRPSQKITYQGGIGTSDEHAFITKHYELDAAGWGSPFLLVPEVTNVDDQTLQALVTAEEHDFYISNASPLGVPFNNFKKSSSEELRISRLEKGRPGSPCKKKFLCTNTEFTSQPICTASREYQHLKLAELKTTNLPANEVRAQYRMITEKVCLCEGLCASVYLKNDMLLAKENNAVSICPGPNLAYFSGPYTLTNMVDHIYGRVNLLVGIKRPNLFINELKLYLDYLREDVAAQLDRISDKKVKYFSKFSAQLQQGIDYYRKLIPEIREQKQTVSRQMEEQLQDLELLLSEMAKPFSRPLL